jgi:hypothetical protein
MAQRGVQLAGLAAALFLTTWPATTQTIVATARGRVTDPSGSAVPGAVVTVRANSTNLKRSTQTDSIGQYIIGNLPAGPYEITVEHAGFAQSKQSNLVLHVGEEATVDFALRLAGAQQAVTVLAEGATVETQHTVGMNISPAQVDELPTFNRSFADLTQLTPGITVNPADGSMGFAAAGQNQYQNNVFVDGGTNAMQFYGTMADTFPQDWIEEFQVLTNNFSAEFGHASGAVLNVITRSGSNAFHGRGYGFFQNAALNSAPYAGHFTNGAPAFLPTTPPYSQYRVGGYLGGRIIKDKLFFFGGFEDLDNSATGTLGISQYWINQGVSYIIPESYTVRPYIVKADWNISANNRLSFRHDSTNQTLHSCAGQIGVGCNNQPLWVLESRGLYTGPIWSVIGNLTSTFGGRAFNEVRFYYGVNKVSIFSNLTGNKLGGDTLLADTKDLGLFSEKSYPGAHFGSGSLGGLEGETNLYFDDNFSYIVGRHQLKFGGEISRPQMNMNIDASQHGRWTFGQDLAFNSNNPASYPYQYLITLGVPISVENHWNGVLYAQDTWKVRDNLTLNLGVRWEDDTAITAGNQYVAQYNQLIQGAYGGSTPAFKVKPENKDFSPRIGVVWAPTADRRTTIRAGGGIFFDQMHYNYADIVENQNLLGKGRFLFNSKVTSQNPFYNSADPAGSAAKLQAFLASNFPNPPDLSLIGLSHVPQSATLFDPNFRDPFTAQLSAGATHQFASGLSIQGDFVTSHGRNMIVTQTANLVPPAGETPAQAAQLQNFVSGDPRYSSLQYLRNGAWTQYTALQTRIMYNRGSKLHLGLSYTLSRTTSDELSDQIGGGVMTNPYDISVDDGPANYDRRHSLNLDGMYNLPFGVILSGLYSFGSPLPWNVTSINDTFFRPEPRNSRRGGNLNTTSFRFSKVFKFREGLSATLMWEIFNAFNSDYFYSYAGSLQSSSFGTPANDLPKRAQQGAFRIDF